MLRDLASSVELMLPLIIAGFLHMAVVKLNIFGILNKPISEKRFGRNKTWRGLVIMPLATVVGIYLVIAAQSATDVDWAFRFAGAGIHPVLLGMALGLSYALFELPNSYVKRRLKVAPGKLPTKNRLLFLFVDQADSALGCVLAYVVFLRMPVTVWFFCLLLGPVTHLIANMSLYALGLRKEPF